MRKRKTYKVEAGYMTCPDATRLFLDMVGKPESEYREFYGFFLEGAKQGKFGGKEYKTNMYQVKKSEVVSYARSYDKSDFTVDMTKLPTNTEWDNNTHLELKSKEINTIITFEEQGIFKTEEAYAAIKRIMKN